MLTRDTLRLIGAAAIVIVIAGLAFTIVVGGLALRAR